MNKRDKIADRDEIDVIPPLMKGLSIFLLILIPILAYFILRSDPIIYSNNIESDQKTLNQVQVFASFIKTRPEMVQVRPLVEKKKVIVISSGQAKLNEEELERIHQIEARWNELRPVHDDLWKNEMEALFKLAERTQDEGALDLISVQIVQARTDQDDLTRHKADEWFTRYTNIEKRQSKLEKVTDFFRESVLQKYEDDNRTINSKHD